MSSLKRETIQFPNGNQAQAVYAPRGTNPQQIIQALALPRPRGLLVLNGGTAQLEPDLQAQLGHLLGDGLARVAAEEGLTLVTGGTDAGVFALLGEGLARWGRTAPCVGVVVADLAKWPDKPAGEAWLEPHHSHFVLVEGKNWGDETTTMYELIGALSQAGRCPSLAIFVGGGGITRDEMEANVEQGRKMVLLAGSGRMTDSVISSLLGRQISDARVMQIALKGGIIPFAISGEPSALSDLILRSLFEQAGDG